MRSRRCPWAHGVGSCASIIERNDHNAELRHMAQERSNVVIIGGGIMGGDIGTIFAASGWDVHVMSPSQKTRDALPARTSAGLQKLGADASAASRVKTYSKLEDIDWSGV